MKYNPIDIARQFNFVREAQIQNTGLMVESIQHWSGGQKGESWCAYFMLFVFDIAYGGKENNPLKRSGAVQDIYDAAKDKEVSIPMPGDLFIYVNDANHAHHIGLVTSINPLSGIAGNTSEDGRSSNGDRVAEHTLITNPAHIKFLRF